VTPSAWYATLRPYSFPASLAPALAAPAVALYDGVPMDWYMVPLFLLAALAFHAGTNVLNDYYDFVNGVDADGVADGAGVLVNGTASPRFMVVSGHLYFAMAVVLSVLIAALRGWEVLVLAAVGGGLAYLYTGKRISLKYHAAGDVMVFLLLGPAMTGAGFYSMTGTISANALFAGVIPGLLVTIILEANNIRDMESDRAASVRTLAGFLGRRRTVVLYVGLVILVYALPIVQWLAGGAPVLSIAVLAGLPIAIKCVRTVLSSSEDREALGGAVMLSAQMESVVGTLYILSFVVGFFFGL
jgi:1,4-dihydroxy-2-naphthoate octaprenyltransferase